MNLAKKLQIKPSHHVLVKNAPEEFALDLPEESHLVAATDRADVVLVFVKDSSELTAYGKPFIEAALRNAIAYVAYPKASQLGTDLNRDILWQHLQKEGLRGVRQVSLDSVWSAMRFRPA